MVKTIYMTVADYWKEKREELLGRLASRDEYEKMFREFVLPRIGAMRISEISLSDIEMMMRWMRESGKRIDQIQRVKALLRRFFHMAVQDRLIAGNLIDMRPGTPTERMELRMLTAEEEVRLLQAFRKTRRGDMYTLMMITGIRFQELAGCRICDLHAEEKYLSITQVTCSRIKGTMPRDGGTRRVPLAETAIRMLQRMIDRIPEEERRADQLIFTTCHGAPFGRMPDEDIRLIRRESGIQDFSARMFGYIYGMRALAMGMNPKVVNQYLGYRTGFNLNRFAQAGRRQEREH